MPGNRKPRLPSTLVTDDKGEPLEDDDDEEEEESDEDEEATDLDQGSESVFEKEDTKEESSKKEDVEATELTNRTEEAATPQASSAASDFRSDGSDDYEYYHRSAKKKVEVVKKVLVDYTKPENNVSIKHLKTHRKNMTQWKKCTLKTLIDEQDCAVEAVKLEWLLKSDMSILVKRPSLEDSSGRVSRQTPITKCSAKKSINAKDYRRLYDLMKY